MALASIFSPSLDTAERKRLLSLTNEGFILILRLNDVGALITDLIAAVEGITHAALIAEDLCSEDRPFRWIMIMPNGNSIFDYEIERTGREHIERAAREEW